MSSELLTTPSSANIIQAHELGKCYKIYDNPKARLKQAICRGRKQYYREFWALKNISFEVKSGESLGIIGRNGSGKSTLLQMICGTLSPTEGNLRTKGRIAALLELGSGFNPEFTGLENVYLNASLLGLSKEETDAKLDEILAFADIGEFCNQPVKTYSSGMSLRLAFAVIAHVNADILVIDEALAVGDAIFTQRCMRFIRKMREERCLLFVSHDAETVKSLCSHALWLSKGSTKNYGNCKDITYEYLMFSQAQIYGEEINLTQAGSNSGKDEASNKAGLTIEQVEDHKSYDREVVFSYTDNLKHSKGWNTGDAELVELSIRSLSLDNNNALLKGGEKVEINILAKANKNLNQPIIGFIVRDRLGQNLFGENTLEAKTIGIPKKCEPGCLIESKFELWFPMLPSGTYTLLAAIADGDGSNYTQHHWVEDALIINVSSSKVRYGLAGAFVTAVSQELNSPGEDQTSK